jgi:uncharacterized protein
MIAQSSLLPGGIAPERIAACIGLVSDTHVPEGLDTLHPTLFEVLRGVDVILHAGDVGDVSVLDRLSAIAPVIAVVGNDDSREAERILPLQQVISVAGQRIVLSHSHYPEREVEMAARKIDAWGPKLDWRAEFGHKASARIAVSGHTHIPMVIEHQGVVLVNPGVAGAGTSVERALIRTTALLFVLDDGSTRVTHVNLAEPDRAYDASVQWEAGYKANWRHYGEWILSPALTEDWPRLLPIIHRDLMAFKLSMLRIAYRCWMGQQAEITHEDVLNEICTDVSVPADLRADLRTVLEQRIAVGSLDRAPGHGSRADLRAG